MRNIPYTRIQREREGGRERVRMEPRDRIGDLGNSLFAGNPTKLENGFVLTSRGSQTSPRGGEQHVRHETLATLEYLGREFIPRD